jgi:hypothetical protein
MKLTTKKVVMGLISPVALIGMLAFNTAQAREPYTKAELADQRNQLIDVVNHGYDLWLAVTVLRMRLQRTRPHSPNSRRIWGGWRRFET